MLSLDTLRADYDILSEPEDRYRLLIDIGKQLEPMPDTLKTPATKVRGCSASVWLYPMRNADGSLHFLADSDAHITKGIAALILSCVQDKSPTEVSTMDLMHCLKPFRLETQLSSNRTQGIPNMIALIKETAQRFL